MNALLALLIWLAHVPGSIRGDDAVSPVTWLLVAFLAIDELGDIRKAVTK